MDSDRLLRWIALALTVAALAWTLDTALSAPRRRARLDRKAEAVRALRRLSASRAPERAWLDALDAAGARTPPPLDRLAAGRFPEGAATASPRTAVPLADGWQRRETLLSLTAIPYAELPAFCDEAARQRPPWRLVEADLRPSSNPGIGDASLLFESLERVGE
jgi:hypothetical protein